jgi:hypothetical protein
MRRAPIFASFALAVCALSIVAHASGDGSVAAFRLPDASAACRATGSTLVCRSLSVRSGIALGAATGPRAARESIWWDASTPVLYSWHGHGIRCSVRAGVIVCANAAGAGISAGPAGIAASL